MFIKKIDEELLKEIREEMEAEHSQIVASWDGEFIDLKGDDFDDTLRSEIFSEYLNIPLDMLLDMIHQHFPFIKEKDIAIAPYSDVMVSENDDYKEVKLRVYAGHFNLDRGQFSETELRQLDKLFEELTQLYEDLDVDTTLNLTHVPIEDVPEKYYEGEEHDEHDFVQIEF